MVDLRFSSPKFGYWERKSSFQNDYSTFKSVAPTFETRSKFFESNAAIAKVYVPGSDNGGFNDGIDKYKSNILYSTISIGKVKLLNTGAGLVFQLIP